MDFFESVHFLVCDDVRDEIGGKSSYMGVYAEDIKVPHMPALARQICLVAVLEGVQGPITHIEALMTPPGLEPVKLKIQPPPQQDVMRHLNIVVAVSPFRIKEEGEIIWELFFNKDDSMRFQHSKPVICASSQMKPTKK